MFRKNSYLKLTHWTLSLVIAFAVLAAALPTRVQAAPDYTCAKTIVAKQGDRLRRIARDNSVSLNRLAKANNLKPPYTLTAGQTLCIPDEPTVSKHIKWTATFTQNTIKVEGTGFGGKKPYNIKVRENDISKWYKLGGIRSDKDGVLSASFTTPKDLKNLPAIKICIKDGTTDALDCKFFYRQ